MPYDANILRRAAQRLDRERREREERPSPWTAFSKRSAHRPCAGLRCQSPSHPRRRYRSSPAPSTPPRTLPRLWRTRPPPSPPWWARWSAGWASGCPPRGPVPGLDGGGGVQPLLMPAAQDPVHIAPVHGKELCAQEQIQELSKLLDLGEQSFDSFRLDYYSQTIYPGRGSSPRSNMELVYDVCLNYRPCRPGCPGGTFSLQTGRKYSRRCHRPPKSRSPTRCGRCRRTGRSCPAPAPRRGPPGGRQADGNFLQPVHGGGGPPLRPPDRLPPGRHVPQPLLLRRRHPPAEKEPALIEGA